MLPVQSIVLQEAPLQHSYHDHHLHHHDDIEMGVTWYFLPVECEKLLVSLLE